MLAVPDESAIRKPEDFEGKIIATELVNTTRNYFAAKGVKVTVEFSWGTTEIKARLLDGIVELTETGSSHPRQQPAHHRHAADQHHRASSPTRRPGTIPWKREKMENIAMLLKGAIEARAKVGLKMNVPEAQAGRGDRLPAGRKEPDGQPPGRRGWVAVEVILEEKQERELIPAPEARRGDGDHHLSAEQGDSVRGWASRLGS